MILTASGAEYDPERTLWKPGRRAFFFFGLGAAVAPFLPDVANSVYGVKGLYEGASIYSAGHAQPLTEEMVAEVLIRMYHATPRLPQPVNTIRRMAQGHPPIYL